MKKREELTKYIEKVKTIGKEEYQEIARLFQKLVMKDILDIWIKHKKKIDMRLNKVPICLEGSAVNSSTAFGFSSTTFKERI